MEAVAETSTSEAARIKQAKWQATKLMERLVDVAKKFPPQIVLPILCQLTYDFAQFHGANLDDVGKIMAAVHVSRTQMAEADAARIITPAP